MSAVRGEKWVRTLERSLHMLSDTQRWGCLCRVNQITVSSLILCHAHGCFHFSLLSSLIYYWGCTIAQAYIRLSLLSSQSRLGLEPPQTGPICYRRVVCVNWCVWFPINHCFECRNSQIFFFTVICNFWILLTLTVKDLRLRFTLLAFDHTDNVLAKKKLGVNVNLFHLRSVSC